MSKINRPVLQVLAGVSLGAVVLAAPAFADVPSTRSPGDVPSFSGVPSISNDRDVPSTSGRDVPSTSGRDVPSFEGCSGDHCTMPNRAKS